MASLSWQLAQRYRKSRNSNAFIRFIAASSTLGIGLGVGILILALSVMNGFEQALRTQFLAVIPHVELQSVKTPLGNWQQHLTPLVANEAVAAGAPYIKTNALLRIGSKVKAASLRGIDPSFEEGVSELSRFIQSGQMTSLGRNEIVLGQGVAKELGAQVGDEIQLMLPKLSADGKLASQQQVSVVVSGIIAMGGQLDHQQSWVQLEALASWLQYPDGTVQGLAFKLHDVFAAPQVAYLLGQQLPHYVELHHWVRTQGHLYADIQMVRSILYLVLVLVLAVACFNIVATLVMAVREKQGDIAILMTMGMPRRAVVKAFMWLGWLNGVVGTCVGGLIGVLLAWQIEALFRMITSLTGFQLLDSSIYFVDYVPSKIDPLQVLMTIGVALVLSLLATLYPALQASKVEPAIVLGRN